MQFFSLTKLQVKIHKKQFVVIFFIKYKCTQWSTKMLLHRMITYWETTVCNFPQHPCNPDNIKVIYSKTSIVQYTFINYNYVHTHTHTHTKEKIICIFTPSQPGRLNQGKQIFIERVQQKLKVPTVFVEVKKRKEKKHKLSSFNIVTIN